MMLLWGLVAALLLGLVTGGALSNLSQHRLAFEWALAPLLVTASVLPVIRVPIPDKALVLAGWILPMALCLVAAAANLRHQGFRFIIFGLLLNLAVVTANMAMPVLVGNMALVGGSADAEVLLARSWLHEGSGVMTRLLILADVIPVPGPTGFRGMMSLGDALLLIGVAKFVFVGMHEVAAESVPVCEDSCNG